MRPLALVALIACATAPEPKPEQQPQIIAPSLGGLDCNVARDSHKFNADMREVPIEKALAGMADVTCLNFKLMPGTTGTVTMVGDPPNKAYAAPDLLDLFIKCAAASGITLHIQGDYMVVERTASR